MCVWVGGSYQVGNVSFGHGPEREKERRGCHLLARRVDVSTVPAEGVLVGVVGGLAPVGRYGGRLPPAIV